MIQQTQMGLVRLYVVRLHRTTSRKRIAAQVRYVWIYYLCVGILTFFVYISVYSSAVATFEETKWYHRKLSKGDSVKVMNEVTFSFMLQTHRYLKIAAFLNTSNVCMLPDTFLPNTA